MKVEIDVEWLKSMDDDIREPGLPTAEDFIELARRKRAIRRHNNFDEPVATRESRVGGDLVTAGK
jgi:hypothetical protein